MPYSWVTRRTSSTVVTPWATLLQPSAARVFMPCADGLLLQGAGISPLEDKRPNHVIYGEELINTRAALIAGVGAGGDIPGRGIDGRVFLSAPSPTSIRRNSSTS